MWCLDGGNHLGFLRILKDYHVWLHLSKGNLNACGFLDSPLPFARNVYSLLERWGSTFFFFLISNVYISKAQRGATLVHREYPYTRETPT